ncbi:MAG TPA: ATP-binding cassette domain-containing protein, partial [Bacillota bacterium]|nr:ATP-binding cassette domain-containing protein [Bacillota bacterium]
MADILTLKNINKTYGENTKNPNQVLFDINLNFEEKSFNSIIGQSGSGKSTLLNIIGTLDKPTSGEVLIEGKSLKDFTKDDLADVRNRSIGFIFQFHYLLPEFTALENVLMPYRISKQPVTKEVLARAEELLELVGLKKFMNQLAINLSG